MGSNLESAVLLAEGLEPADRLLGSICRTQNHPDASDSDRRRLDGDLTPLPAEPTA